jgi:hypothetical protein
LTRTEDVRKRGYVASTARALRQPCHAPRLLVTRLHGLYLTNAVHRDYSSPGRTGSISTMSCAATTHIPVALARLRRASQVHVSRLQQLYFSYVVRREYLSPGCTGSSAPMPCIRTRHLAARLLVGRSHWLSSCVWSLRLAARLLVVWIASALPRLCHAPRRTVSTLDFSSVGHTGSRRASGHCVSRRDYSSFGLHQLYRAYAVHPDAPS